MISRRLKLSVKAKLKAYKVQEMVFSCLRSKVAYENDIKLSDIFKKNGNRDIFSCKLMSCNTDIKTRIENVVDTIIDNMDMRPIFYNGFTNIKNKRDAQGYMLWKSNTIYISFRGTSDICDIIDVVDIRPKRLMKDIAVHNGFAEQFFSLEPKITNDIKEIISSFPIERIIFTGHSMGGSIATIAAAYYASMFTKMYITCHTFGTPATGNQSFVDWFKDGVDESTRLEIEEDLVPLIPINKQFHHIPDGVRLKENGDVDNSYEVTYTTYADIISKLLRKSDLHALTVNHSCEKYLERLLSIKYVKKDDDICHLEPFNDTS